MLTPVFEINQNESFIELIIKAPFAKISDAEISIDGKEFFFFSKPYFLRLHFPHELIENGDESATYDSDLGSFSVKVPKKIKGEHFPGLEFITKLLTPSEKTSAAPLIEMIDSDESRSNFEQENDTDRWYFDQKLDSQSPSCSKTENFCLNYGFASQQHGVFTKLREDIWNLIDVNDPDSLTVEERKFLTFNDENSKFSESHYLADFFESDQIEELISFVCPWDHDENLEFTENDNFRLKNLPKRTYSLDKYSIKSVALSLVDIIFACAFNNRTTEGENNVESAWLITKISPTLSCLLNWTVLKEPVIRSIRRSLCFPLNRNWNLSMKVLDDVRKIFKFGRRTILKCLLDLHEIFSNAGDFRYVLNELYITDYCVWIQNANDKIFARLAEDLCQLKLEKSDVQLDLEEIELAGKLAMLESTENSLHANRGLKTKEISQDPVEVSLDSDDSSETESSSESGSKCIQEKIKNLKLFEETN